jgi:uncharacterized cupin superfamily protein
VSVNDKPDHAIAIADGPAPDVQTDSARPGFSSTRIWVTDRTPARVDAVTETLILPPSLEPPPRGSLCRIVTFPPDSVWRGKVGAGEARAYFEAAGSPEASTYSPAQPYMQKTETLDFCIILEGEITLVLDTEEVDLREGDTVVQRGTNHAWSNRSNRPCTVGFTSHDGYW